ncbi:MAG: hypothetical protein DRJ40_10520 [Thermoprotei archaeon]|nr:MAG: hypothetical protein DRJ40_10520 [Thermoprotei archaeon]
MEVLVAEYVCCSSKHLYALKEFITEGFAMAYYVARDLASCGVSVDLALCPDVLSRVTVPRGVGVVCVPRELDLIDFLREYCDRYDYVVAIAPPPQLIRVVDVVGDRFLGSEPRLVKLFSNKFATIRLLGELGIDVPPTVFVHGSLSIPEVSELGFPVVAKPVDCAGGSGTSLVTSCSELKGAVSRALSCSEVCYALVQEYVPGTHMSISAIVRDGDVTLLSLNLQFIGVNHGFRYYGGLLPLRRFAFEATSLVRRVVEELPGLRGYVGFDVIYHGGSLYVVEVNPRLTTSYVGLSKLLGPKAGLYLLSAVSNVELKTRVPLISDRYSYYVLTEFPSLVNGEEIIYVPGISIEMMHVDCGDLGYVESRLRTLLPQNLRYLADVVSTLLS